MPHREELVSLAARIYAETLSGNKVAVRLDVSHSTAYRLLRAAGIDLPDRHGAEVAARKRKLHGARAEAVVKDYAAGMALVEIKSKHGVGEYAIRTAVRLAGVPERPRGGKAKRFTAEHLAEAKRLYSRGLSQAQIAAIFGMGLATVNRALRLSGAPVRAARARGSAHGSWKGGKVTTSQGYTRRLVANDDPLFSMADNGGYVLEHRLVMARTLGRPLTKDETVHHIDGDRSNNKLSNLQLRLGVHGKGVTMSCAKCGCCDIQFTALAD